MKTEVILRKMRVSLEKIDAKIISLLSERFRITHKIQNLKRGLAIPLSQKNREDYLLKKYLKLAVSKKVPLRLTERIFKYIFSYSKKSGIMKRK